MGERSRRVGVGTLLLVLLVAWWWSSAPDRRPFARLGPRPGETETARIRWRAAPTPMPITETPTPTPAPEEPEPAVPRVELVVLLPHNDIWLPLNPDVFVEHDVHPEDFWPRSDEAPWPDLESAESMQDLAELARTQGYRKELLVPAREFVAAAEADGLLDDPELLATEDPWAGLVAMQAERVDALVAHEAEGGFGFLGLPWFEPVLDLSESVAIADAIVEAWPDEAVADYARLQLLEAYSDPKSSVYDPEVSLAMIRDMLSSEDEVVSEAAAQRLAVLELDTTPVEEPEVVLAELTDVLDELSTDGRYLVSSFAMKVLHESPDAGDMGVWVDRMQETASRCGAADHCEAWRDDAGISTLLSRMQFASGIAPTTWQGEVQQAVYACDAADAVHEKVKLEGVYGEGWTWSGPDPLCACLRRWRWDMRPDAPVRADVDVYAFAPGTREEVLGRLTEEVKESGREWDFQTGWGRELAWLMVAEH